MKKLSICLLLVLAAAFNLYSQDAPNPTINTAIRKHGLEKSKVMDIASWVCDVYGPRLTGSPMLDKATDWAQKSLKEWGMSNVHLEAWGPFGRGWEFNHFAMHATAPNYFPIIGYPKAWSPSTKGVVSGEVIYLKADDEEDLKAFKGKLKGKFVFLDTIRTVKEPFEAPAARLNAQELLDMANSPAPGRRPDRDFNRLGGLTFNQKLFKFIADEEPLAVIDRGFKGDLGTVFVTGARAVEGRVQDAAAKVIPQATISVEHYNRIFRLMQKGIPVTLSLDLKANYTNPDGMEHNIIAEIPGTDLKDEIVMLGAHFDSWHAGTGATDNGAGSSVMMEAVRILLETIKETGIKPRRTIRLALWTGEEQGLLGSRGYVKDHFANAGPDGTIQSIKEGEQSKISGYFNLDNGTGKVRGVFLQGNAAVSPIFRAWLDPFKDLGAATLTLQNTGGTDHLAFDAAGIPGFQFIQEPIAYSTRTHHSNMDNIDHLVEDDLKQAATVIASFVMHTAMRDEKLPRKVTELKAGSN